MKFTELDRKMRVYETAHDLCVLPGIHMLARLDGRGFTKLLRERHPFETPFDPRFRDLMVETGRHLMDCGFKFLLCYSQSDEISLLFDPDENSFGRKIRKLNSVLAGEASAKFSLLLGDVASFDCRISQLPRAEDVVDYYRWRNEDAHRNALSAHCYWLLRKQGRKPEEAQKELDGLADQPTEWEEKRTKLLSALSDAEAQRKEADEQGAPPLQAELLHAVDPARQREGHDHEGEHAEGVAVHEASLSESRRSYSRSGIPISRFERRMPPSMGRH